MSTYFEAELQRIIAVAEENEKISSEYANKFFRVFLTASEAKEILKIITNSKDYEVAQDKLPS